jgi:hypothetical protein
MPIISPQPALDLLHPGYVSGRRYGPLLTQALVNTAPIAANTLYAQYLPVHHPVPIAGLSIRLGTAVPGVKGKLCLYTLDGDKLAEIANDLDMGGAVGPTDGLFSASLVPPAGLYIATACFDGAAQPGTWPHNVVQAGGFAWYTGGASISGITTGTTSSRLTAALTFGATNTPFFPDTLPALTLGTASPGSPYIAFMAA